MAKIMEKNWFFILLLIIIAIYMGVYIYQTSFVSYGERYFVLFDDAMISMTFAKNLANGYGLVWNPGETPPIEGYTNPLWVIFMAFFHLFPIPLSKMSLIIQICGALFLLGNLVIVKRIAEELSESIFVPYLAVIITALYVPLNNWGLQGMEVSALALMISAGAYLSILSIKNEKFSKSIYLVFFIGTFIRMDMVVPYLVFLGFMFIVQPKYRMQHVLWGVGLLALSISSQTIFRYFYYGDLLPNTYYLKMTGMSMTLRVKRGLYVLYQFIRDFNWLLFLLPFLVLIFRLEKSSILLALLFLAQIAYSVYVGGDAWEHKGGANRYIAVAISLFFILFVYGLEQIKNSLFQSVKDHESIIKPLGNIGLAIVVFLSILNFNFGNANLNNIKRIFLLYPPSFIEGNVWNLEIVQAVNKVSTPQAEVAVIGAGSIPYYTGRQAIDILGKCDPVIARLPSHIPSGGISEFRPGHMKWDYEHSIGKFLPDMVLGLWENAEEAEEIINEYYTEIQVNGRDYLVLKDSSEILWDQVD
jgi:hypothetical protein